MINIDPVPQGAVVTKDGRFTPEGFRWFDALRTIVVLLATHVHLVRGDPNGSEYGSVGHLALRLDGAPGATLYTKESGSIAVPTNTDWRAV